MSEPKTLEHFTPLLKWWWDVNEFKGNATIGGQFRKLIDEIQELFEGLKKKDEKEIKDALGDIQVVCIIGCFILGNEVKRSGLKLLHFDSIELGIATVVEAFLSVPLFSLHTIRRVAVELGYDPNECLSLAWEEIKDRRGHWENGVFVKHVNKEGAL